MKTEPEALKDLRNAFGYLIITSLVTIGVMFVLIGMISPVFLPWICRKSDELAAIDPDTPWKAVYVTGVILWFLGSWAFFVICHLALR